MKWIKHGEKRVNLENIAYFERFDFKRRSEDSDNIRPIFAIKFIFNSVRDEFNFEFLTHEEREDFLKLLDQDLLN